MNPDLKVYATDVSIDGANDAIKTGMSGKVEILIDELKDVLYVPIQSVVTVDEILVARQRVNRIHVDESIVEYVLKIANATRSHDDVRLGMGVLVLVQVLQGLQVFFLVMSLGIHVLHAQLVWLGGEFSRYRQ